MTASSGTAARTAEATKMARQGKGGEGGKKGKASKGQAFDGCCNRCGKYGHREADCWSKAPGRPRLQGLLSCILCRPHLTSITVSEVVWAQACGVEKQETVVTHVHLWIFASAPFSV